MFDMSKNDHIDRIWDIVDKVGVCMLTTQFPDGLRARPLEARPDRDAGLIFFVTDIHSAKEDEIEGQARSEGKSSLFEHALRLAQQGSTTLEEALLVAVGDE